jgi:hypothetical protein
MADEKQTKCLRCGSTNRVHGTTMGPFPIVFQKDHSLIFGKKSLNAWVCVDCGHVELVLEQSKSDQS